MSKNYDNYIIEHRTAVETAYQWLVDHKIIKDQYRQVIDIHDVSKWGNEEYDAYDKYFYGNNCIPMLKFLKSSSNVHSKNRNT